jgi:predicted GNAT family acetyltransferase
MECFRNYGAVKLLDIECQTPYAWDEAGATHVRAAVPSGLENTLDLQGRGFQFADRLLDVSINLRRCKLDLDSLARITPRLSSERREEVRRIALESFPRDRRFHLGLRYNAEIAAVVISAWVDELKEYYICERKGEVMGFLALKDSGDNRAFVHLAAVGERYRSSGVAASLYAVAVKECRDREFISLDGRISTLNAPVMNLYSFFGASFSNPTDVFLKEV